MVRIFAALATLAAIVKTTKVFETDKPQCQDWCDPFHENHPHCTNHPGKCGGCFACLVPQDDNSAKYFNVTVLAGEEVMVTSSAKVGKISVQAGGKLKFRDVANLVLSVRAIDVHGTLEIGTKEAPLIAGGLTITLRGGSDHGIYEEHADHSKGIMAHTGAIVDMHGKAYGVTWARLQESAEAGRKWIRVDQQVANDWQPGDEIVVVTTVYHDEKNSSLCANHADGCHQNEVMTIESVNGKKVTLTEKLKYFHYGGSEYQAEVGLLSRTITVQGDDKSENNGFGGHTMCMNGSTCRFSYVKGFRMGQQNVMGRYPFHLHRMGDVADASYFEGCAVHRSYQRAFTVHATSNTFLKKNVAYDVIGSAVYLEDGVERNLLIENNLIAHVHVIEPRNFRNYGSGQEADPEESKPSRLIPTDLTAACFYCLNADNRWINNAASGGFVGFLFPAVGHALGLSYNNYPTYVPEEEPLLEFRGNTAHSSGKYWSKGACIYVGGRLENPDKSNLSHYKYDYGRTSNKPSGALLRGGMVFQDTKTFICRRGFLFWGAQGSQTLPHVALDNFKAYDVSDGGLQMLGKTAVYNGEISAHTSGNTGLWGITDSDKALPSVALGMPIYDTGAQMIVTGIKFMNFDRSGDRCFEDTTFSSKNVPESMGSVSGLRFQNTVKSKRIHHVAKMACEGSQAGSCKNQCAACPGTSVSSLLSNVLDLDGSVTGFSAGGIVGSSDGTSAGHGGISNEWWNLGDATCTKSKWNMWACPRTPKSWSSFEREIVAIKLETGTSEIKPQTFDNTNGATRAIQGTVYHFGHSDRKIQVGLAGQSKVTGSCCDIGWYLMPDAPLSEFTIFMGQMVNQAGLIFATPCTSTSGLQVQRKVGGALTTVTLASSKEAFLNAAGEKYFYESSTLFLKLVDEGNSYYQYKDGARVLLNGNWKNRYVTVSKISGNLGSVSMSLPAFPAEDWMR